MGVGGVHVAERALQRISRVNRAAAGRGEQDVDRPCTKGRGIGANLYRRNYGEPIANLASVTEFDWYAGNFLKYGAAESSFGSKNAGDLPVDAHMLIALCAPRLTFISYGVPERGDANWLDQQGSYMATVAAGPVFRLLGARDIGEKEDYRTAKMPPFNTSLLEGELA